MKYDIEYYESLSQENKKALCRSILYSPSYWKSKYSDDPKPLSKQHKDLMLHVFKNHPNANSKRLDEVYQIFVLESQKSRTFNKKGRAISKCFNLLYNDGTCDDISFIKCIETNTKRANLRKRKRFIEMPKIKNNICEIPSIAENLNEALVRKTIPASAGVYFIWYKCALHYIGCSKNILQRLSDDQHIHLINFKEKYVSYITCDCKDSAIKLESDLIRELTPAIKTLKNNCSVARSLRNKQN